MTTLAEALVHQLEQRGVDLIFGIPGVHTLELYRGLSASSIRHITPRHEQGAGFMADGYARVSGKPGVAFVITGPGVTNVLTPMAQARADSVPMLVVSSVNASNTLGKGMGHLHELPNQQAVVSGIALTSTRVESAAELTPILDEAFTLFSSARPGPVHIEIPLDIAGAENLSPSLIHASPSLALPGTDQIEKAAELLVNAQSPVILIGGGACHAETALKKMAIQLDAPVVQTVNARGIMHHHPLIVPASPSLQAVRDLMGQADVVLCVGSELGPTDYDMYAVGSMAQMNQLIRIDICPEQLARHATQLALCGDSEATLQALLATFPKNKQGTHNGAERAKQTRKDAFNEIGPDMQALTQLLNVARETVPQAIMVGDSAQPIYAGNLYYDHDRAGRWFNAATGYGALGYAIPAAIGASLAEPDAPVLCLTGDGGAQFSLPELMTAKDNNQNITFIIWNNYGYQEIETSMQAVGVSPIGCDPTPPDFASIAKACSLPFQRCPPEPNLFAQALKTSRLNDGPTMIEISIPKLSI